MTIPTGWHAQKFIVRHWRRGDLLDGEAFVLVPDRDPAALAAIVTYATVTPDPALAGRLRAWIASIEGEPDVARTPTPDDRLPGWIATLADHVRDGTMTPETAMLRLAALLR
jgi:hypothetical protein